MPDSVLLVREDREYLCRVGDELQTDLGVLNVPEGIKSGGIIETHLGEVFHVYRPRGPDFFRHFERTGAPMMPRDIGLLIGHLGIEPSDRVLDVGTGTGVLAAYLGLLGANVMSFERNPEFAQIARKNMSIAGVSEQVEVITGDIRDEYDCLSGFTVLTIDTFDADSVVQEAQSLLTRGGRLVVYSPFIEQAREAVTSAQEIDLTGVVTFETIQREMDFDDRGTRPSPTGVGHTGYLTIAYYR